MEVVNLDAIAYYSYATCAWLSLQAIPLILSPSLVGFVLESSREHTNSVEDYYARSLGLSQLVVGLLVVSLSGAIPLTSMVDNSSSPFASSMILISGLYHIATSAHTVTRYYSTGNVGYLLGCIGSTGLACFGLWCLMFGFGQGHISKRTGEDKRTSSYPFTNASAEKKRQRLDKLR